MREPQETLISRIPGSTLVPLHELPARAGSLPADRDIVCICSIGMRSAQAAYYLALQGFPRVSNLLRGVNGWATDVDPSLPVY